ncbi:hypothetical protein BDF22DRAFT_688386 [Syncephalis plumigaleata]|nr:hypothetical protein BDF22DRAFT_688386 [Syncephalis plumigaleata]
MTVLVNQTLSPFLLGLIDSIHAHGYDISYTSSTLAHPGDITCTERALAIFVSLAVPSDNIRNNMHRYRLAVNLYTNVHVIIVQRDNSSAVDFLKIQSWFLSEIPSIQLHMIYDVEQVSIRVIQLVGNCNSLEMNKGKYGQLQYQVLIIERRGASAIII